jgi:hypothetical protein
MSPACWPVLTASVTWRNAVTTIIAECQLTAHFRDHVLGATMIGRSLRPAIPYRQRRPCAGPVYIQGHPGEFTSAVRLLQRTGSELVASSSRSQIAVRAASAVACLTWERSSVCVRW